METLHALAVALHLVEHHEAAVLLIFVVLFVLGLADWWTWRHLKRIGTQVDEYYRASTDPNAPADMPRMVSRAEMRTLMQEILAEVEAYHSPESCPVLPIVKSMLKEDRELTDRRIARADEDTERAVKVAAESLERTIDMVEKIHADMQRHEANDHDWRNKVGAVMIEALRNGRRG